MWQTPKIFVKADKTSAVPENSIYVTTSGLPGLNGLGFILTREPIKLSDLTSSAHKEYLKTFGWSTAKVEDWLLMMRNPMRAFFGEGDSGSKQLTLYRSDNRFGTATVLGEKIARFSHLPAGVPSHYQDRLRQLAKIIGHGSSTHAQLMDEPDHFKLHAECLSKISSYLRADGWMDNTLVMYNRMHTPTAFAKGAAPSLNSGFEAIEGQGVARSAEIGISKFNGHYGGKTGMSLSSSSMEGGSSPHTTVLTHLIEAGMDDPKWVYLVTYTGHRPHANYAPTFSVFKRRRQCSDGNVVYYLMVAPNQMAHPYIRKEPNSGGDLSNIHPHVGVLYADGPVNDGGDFFGSLRSEAKGLFAGEHMDSLNGKLDLPFGVERLRPESAFSEPFYVYGLSGQYDITVIDYTLTKNLTATKDGSAAMAIYEKQRNFSQSAKEFQNFLNMRADGMQGAERINALKTAEDAGKGMSLGTWYSATVDSIPTDLATVTASGPLSGIKAKLKDWKDFEFSYRDGEGSEKMGSYDLLRGEISKANLTSFLIPSSNSPVETDPVLVEVERTPTTQSSLDTLTYYVNGREEDDLGDVMKDLRKGARLSLKGDVTFAEAFPPYKSLGSMLEDDEGANPKIAYALSEGHGWCYGLSRSPCSEINGFHHIVSQKEQSSSSLSSFDITSYNNLFKFAF